MSSWPTPHRGEIWLIDFDPALAVTSWVKCEQILTLSKSRLLGSLPIGKVTPEQLSQVELAVKLSLQLP